jgi:hypothetical protein
MRYQNLRENFAVVPVLLAAAMPKCPLCLAALLSSFGIGISIEAYWILPAMLIFLILSVGLLGFRAQHRRGLKPFCLGFIGAVLILFAKFYFDLTSPVYLGAILLIGASFWNSIPLKKANQTLPPNCDC